MSYNDKRLIINAREPRENEFVMADNVTISMILRSAGQAAKTF